VSLPPDSLFDFSLQAGAEATQQQSNGYPGFPEHGPSYPKPPFINPNPENIYPSGRSMKTATVYTVY